MRTEALREYHEIISKRARQLIEELGTRSGMVDLTAWLSYFTYVPGLSSFGPSPFDDDDPLNLESMLWVIWRTFTI